MTPHRTVWGTLIRYFLCLVQPKPALSRGVMVFPLTSFVVFLVGPLETLMPGLGSAGARAILVATITATADQRLGKTAGTLEKSGGSTHQQRG